MQLAVVAGLSVRFDDEVPFKQLIANYSKYLGVNFMKFNCLCKKCSALLSCQWHALRLFQPISRKFQIPWEWDTDAQNLMFQDMLFRSDLQPL